MAISNTDPGRSWTQLRMVGGFGAVAMAGGALAGWVFGIDRLTALSGHLIPMAPSTAVLFGLFGALLMSDERIRPADEGAQPWKLALAGVGTAAAGILLVFSSLGISPAIEHLWLEISGNVAGVPVGHMSPLTALGFVLVGATYLLATLPARSRRPRTAFTLAALVTMLAVTLTLAYLLSRPILYDTGIIPPALNTSLAFLALGGGLLGLCARRVWAGEGRSLQPQPVLPILGILTLATFLVLTPGYLLFRDYAADFRTEVEEHLLAVADLKITQLESWRSERFSDASIFRGNRVFADLFEASLYRNDPRATRGMEAWLTAVAEAYDYPRIVLVDSAGRRRLTVPDTGRHAMDAPPGVGWVMEALRTGEVFIRDFHKDAPDGPVHLSAIAPVIAEGRTLGAVVLRSDPAVKLYPTLQRPPTPSRTAETLLVRRDGDHVVFLNDLRFQENAALNLRLPITDRDLPAARAVQGTEGIVEGRDYRGERVVAAVRKVAGVDWWLVTKVNAEEAFGPLRVRLGWTVAAVMVLLLGVAGGLGFSWQRREKIYYRRLARTEERHRTLLHSIGDAVISTDPLGRIELMNPVAEELTGWPEDEARGRPLEDVFHIIDEETREPVEDPVATVMRRDTVVGLANSAILVARDGTERPIADSGAPVRGVDGDLTGVVLVFRDQTEEREAQRELEKAVARAQTYLDVAGVIVVVLDDAGRVEVVNRRGEEILGYTREEMVDKVWFEHFIPEDQRDEVRAIHKLAVAGDEAFPKEHENEVLTREGEERTIRWRNAVVRDEDGAITRTISSGLDVTERRRAEEALRRNEARYRNLFNSIRDAIVVADTDRVIIGCNPAFEELFGYEEEEVLGMQTAELYASREEFEAMGAELEEHVGEPSFIQTVRFRKKSGEVFPGETNAFYLTDSQGEVLGFIGLIRDITQRQEAQRALEESEARFRTLYEAAPIGIFRTRSDGRALAINQSMAEILGFDTPEEAVNYYQDLAGQLYVRPERRAEFLRTLREQGSTEAFEYEARRSDGQTIWVEMHARVAGENDDGTFDIEGFAFDVTGEKRREEELGKRQKMLERTEQLATIGSWEMDIETGEVTWSDELFRIFGRDPSQGAPPLDESSDLLPPEDLDRLQAMVAEAIEHGTPYDVEFRAIRADGEIRICHAMGYPERGPDGRVVRLYGTFNDITEKKRREEREAELQSQLAQSQKMESIGRLAGGVAHDFNNMLSVILGHAEIAQDRLDPADPLHEDLEEVRKAAENSAQLTRQLLAFAREQVTSPEVLDLNDTIGSMLKMLGRVIGENIDLRWRPADSVWPVRMDPVQIDQVLTNLLVNARDAIDGVGQVTIETDTVSIDAEYAEVHPDARPGDYVVLSINDSGPGMEPAVAERVFDPFFTTKDLGEGTGLGLATVYGIVHQNDGFIHLYTEPGQGATFKVYLPRSDADATGPRERGQPDTTDGVETVLVVEDQEAVLGLVEKILGGLGYTVLTADTPGTALELAEAHEGPIHLLITDVVMPEMNGLELAEQLTERSSGLRVLFMSGYAEDVIAERGVIEEGVHFVEKPFTRSELSVKVREAIEDR